MRIGDGLVGVLLALLGVAVVLNISTFPTQAGFFGPSLFPGMVAAGLLICGTLLFLRAARGQVANGFSIRNGEQLNVGKAASAALLMLLSILAYAFVGEMIGFQIISFVTILVFGFWLGRTAVFSFTTAIVLTVLFDVLFRILLRVPLPLGLLEGIL
jgi:putative tricarboxylic transport membrane protein